MLISANMYYVMHKQENLTRVAIYLGTHDHPMVEGRSRKKFNQVKSLVAEEVSCTLGGGYCVNHCVVVSKTFLSEHLLNEDGEGPMEVLKGNELCQVMDKFITLSSPNIWNLIASFKHQLGNKRYISSIFALKVNNDYCFIQDSCFLRQYNGKKMFMFKMSMHGEGSGYDLVKWMQPKGDLQIAWIMFDHVKHVKGWTTLAYHLYDYLYYKVITITICDMQSKDMEV